MKPVRWIFAVDHALPAVREVFSCQDALTEHFVIFVCNHFALHG